MAWIPNAAATTLGEQILEANAALKAARRDGKCDDITNAAERLDALLDQLPRASQKIA
jgi:hypothetical protein